VRFRGRGTCGEPYSASNRTAGRASSAHPHLVRISPGTPHIRCPAYLILFLKFPAAQDPEPGVLSDDY